MNPTSKVEREADMLIINNRQKLRKIFQLHAPSKQGKISLQEFTKFCKNLKIFPDLISSADLKKLLRNLSVSSGISFSSFEQLIKLLSNHSFNTVAPLTEKVRMLLIHIRNPCKMHYQVTLNFHNRRESLNHTPDSLGDSQQDPMEYDGTTPKRENSKYRKVSASPHRDNGLQVKSLGSYSKKRTKESSVPPSPLSEKEFSPSPSIHSVPRTQLINKKNTDFKKVSNLYASNIKKIRDHYRTLSGGYFETNSSSRSIPSSCITSPNKETISSKMSSCLRSFRDKHFEIVKQKPKVRNSDCRLKAQENYIASIRKKTFSSQLVLGVIFRSWRQVVELAKSPH